MKNYIILFGLMYSSALFAQGAADKDAIDLSAMMDTIARTENGFEPIGNLNVGLKDPDQWQDFYIRYIANPYAGKMRSGGPNIFDTTNNPIFHTDPTYFFDLNEDGIGDVFAYGEWWFKGFKDSPYYPEKYTAILKYQGFPTIRIIGNVDYDGDLIPDLLSAAQESNLFIYQFRSDKDYGQTSVINPIDSIFIQPSPQIWRGFAVSKFIPSHSPQIIFGWYRDNAGVPDYRIGYIRNNVRLSEDTVVWLSYSDSGGIHVTNLAAIDVTGDGISDLLVADNFNIYIFKGGNDFGTYPLIPQNAYYRIKSPRLLDFGTFGFLTDFGKDITACGDITGSGIPYIAVSANVSSAGYYVGYSFLYACGKALDSLYDAIILFEQTRAYGPVVVVDTLKSIDITGRTAGLTLSYENPYYNRLLFRGCDRIPHKTNPQWHTSVRQDMNTGLSVSVFPERAKQFIKARIVSGEHTSGRLSVFDILGRELLSRYITLDIGENIEYLDLSQWTVGTYVLSLETKTHKSLHKFSILR